MWTVVAFNVLLFVFFATSLVCPKGGVEWRTMGIFIGFIVALFTDMYGLPLTISFLSQWLGASYPVLNPLRTPMVICGSCYWESRIHLSR